MSIITENLWERLLNRLPENAANEAIQTLKRGGSFKDVDFFTMKEAEAQVACYRDRAKEAIRAYKRWKTGKAVRSIFGVFRDREGAHLKAHAKDMTALFLDARRDYRDLTKLLMESVSKDVPGRSSKRKGGGHDQ